MCFDTNALQEKTPEKKADQADDGKKQDLLYTLQFANQCMISFHKYICLVAGGAKE